MSAQGTQQVSVPVLGGRVDLATGAANLALRTGAALLPVVTRSRGAGVFEVRIEPPIEAPAASSRADRISAMAAQFGHILERELLEIDSASRICWLAEIHADAEPA
jgi:lauroyl/myristoyl acyltransferase